MRDEAERKGDSEAVDLGARRCRDAAGVTVRLLEDAGAFLEQAGPLLLADEARHNLILGISGTLRESPDRYPRSASGSVSRAASRSRPRSARRHTT